MRLVAVLIVSGAAALASPAMATSIASVTLEDLFHQADVVALVTLRSGDHEHYQSPVYRAEIVTAFKGPSVGDFIHLGPSVGLGIGEQYVVFLEGTAQPVGGLKASDARTKPAAFPAAAPYYRIMYAGYSVMPVDYTCVIPKCDYGVNLVEAQVHLPVTVQVIPSRDDPGHVWIKRTEFLNLLSNLAKPTKGRPRP